MMFQLPAYSGALSVYLSRVLDDAGLNETIVTRRRQLHMQMETRTNVVTVGLENKKRMLFNFGSQTEGTTTIGLNSDLDGLYCTYDFKIIQEWDEWNQGQPTLMMVEDGVAPGYCKLQLPTPFPLPTKTMVPPARGMAYDDFGRVLITNTIIHNKMMTTPGMQRSGPASTRTDRDGKLDEDTVVAFKCNTWPKRSRDWVNRKSMGHWPTDDMKRFCIDSGCFIVPVGHRLSENECVEWRISPSLAERCLMFSLNMAQIKCYVTVKLLMKTYVTPNVGKSISSFHCKTAMFYCVENTLPTLWREENLLKCITLCLFTLFEWVNAGFAPQYFDRKENLFAGKVKPEIKARLSDILRRLIVSKGGCLLKIQYDDLGTLLTEKLSTLPSMDPGSVSVNTVTLIGEFVMRSKYNSHMVLRYILQRIANFDSQTAATTVKTFIHKLFGYRKEHTDTYDAVHEILPYMYTLLGSILASHLLSAGKNIPREVIELFVVGNKTDLCSSRLKLAAIFYCSEEYEKACRLLSVVEKRLASHAFLPACGCTGTPIKPQKDNVVNWLSIVQNYPENKLTAHCVAFCPQEMFCLPPGLNYEMYRAIDDDESLRSSKDDWMNWAVIDSLPFLHYLQFLTYDKLSNDPAKQEALQNLKETVGGAVDLCHQETALNLIGQCMEMAGSRDEAIVYYTQSLEIRPRNNAANWYIRNLSGNS